ncbi:hypothetical protein Q4506_09750 [Colwellia sp. 4_MG-2023]|jgi:hypothetical protein|uniref:hypothetical protein n=1 Tax=unclassified Colwellia TaxID=196834 RepID=UPI001357DEFF|nr:MULTISPECIES: hypothetical protein [unclassified Colwellia]MDO6507131.1 hypothetical protein [Colwellia sp. 5_MG-2023]MDO6555967.1 hypothetical protein [Colwellia sp. 4_MG-2023]
MQISPPSHSPSATQLLEQKIRTGTEPDNIMLLKLWLSIGQSDNLSTKLLRERYTAQFYLLLETIVDDLVPRHWRCTCLDNIYLPLSSLKKIANDDKSEQHLQHLFNELAISTHYVERSLSSY